MRETGQRDGEAALETQGARKQEEKNRKQRFCAPFICRTSCLCGQIAVWSRTLSESVAKVGEK